MNSKVCVSLVSLYSSTVLEKIKTEFGLKNYFQVPNFEKVIVNSGIPVVKNDDRYIRDFSNQIARITAQKPKICKAKNSISNFKLRKGMNTGLQVTLRRHRMYSFLERLLYVAIPRIRDFRGLSINSFDGCGNYNLGLKEASVFMEFDVEKFNAVHGFNISIVTTSNSDVLARYFLKSMGFPFRKSL